ncbi:MAG: phytanoyl-CoA dioxygenase family protein, partial [Candidatus Latescibacteria bacterium]|nr:phytanoyl-CoA dioxygenase family protein [Candidatus Latescibacterota bacterium]
MSIGMTPQQKQDFEQDGFVILEDFLTSEELDRLLKAVDDVA